MSQVLSHGQQVLTVPVGDMKTLCGYRGDGDLGRNYTHSLVDLVACSNFDAPFDKTDHVLILQRADQLFVKMEG